ncbi:uncharacterized protein [Mytilus edulis]|uniref:uncharacterized protein n=1 Tax=Mytilus edulis TaxID=6550 RepID=UPI0039F0D50C
MKISICLVLLIVLVSVGANKANDEMTKDSMYIHTLVKRAPVCGYTSCPHIPCCNGYSCISGLCKICVGRDCNSKNDCCNGFTCSYNKCRSGSAGGGIRPGIDSKIQHH